MAAEHTAAVGTERSVETMRGAARLEHRRAEAVGPAIRRSAHHRRRAADAHGGMLLEGAKVAFDFLEDAIRPTSASTAGVYRDGDSAT